MKRVDGNCYCSGSCRHCCLGTNELACGDEISADGSFGLIKHNKRAFSGRPFATRSGVSRVAIDRGPE